MDIESKRAEILRLIARVNRGDRAHAGGEAPSTRESPAARSRRSSKSPARATRASASTAASRGVESRSRPPDESPLRSEASRAAASARLEMRREELVGLREMRQRIEQAGRSDDRVLEILKSLERRVGEIETLLRSEPRPAQPALPPARENHTLSGTLREGLLADVFQLVSSNVLSGEFTVEGEGMAVRLYFLEGEICHAEGPEVRGESAVFAAMALEDGQYYFRETADLPKERTIESKTQFLILEALRRIDEDRAG